MLSSGFGYVSSSLNIDVNPEFDEGLAEIIDLELRKSEFKNGSSLICSLRCFLGFFLALLIYFFKLNSSTKLNLICPKKNNWFVVYVEWSNRTKHIFTLLDGKEATVVFVGKRAVDNEINKILNIVKTENIDSSRWVILCAGGSEKVKFSEAIKLHRNVESILVGICKKNGQIFTTTKSYIGLQLRLLLALKYLRWAQKIELPTIAYFGHTGIADSGAMDYAVRKNNGRTIHYFHGLSQGYNFFGFSTYAFCICHYDVRVTKQLGGYKLAEYMPAAFPTITSRGCDWLLLTSYAHPSGDVYHHYGIEAEILLLMRFKEAFEASSVNHGNLFWQPHPAMKLLRKKDKEKLLNTAETLGFKPMGNKEYADFSFVLTTPSTVVVDLLKVGILPCVDTFYSLPQFHVVSDYPFELKLKTSKDIVVAANSLKDPIVHNRLFRKSWDAIGPGNHPSFECLLDAKNE